MSYVRFGRSKTQEWRAQADIEALAEELQLVVTLHCLLLVGEKKGVPPARLSPHNPLCCMVCRAQVGIEALTDVRKSCRVVATVILVPPPTFSVAWCASCAGRHRGPDG